MRRRDPLIGAAAVLLFLALWEAATRAAAYAYFPPPSRILAHLLEGGAALEQVAPSLARMLAGWGLAALIGIALGLLIGLLPRLGDFLSWILAALRSLPPVAILPVFLVALGAGDGMKIAFIAFTAVWPILLNTVDGVESTDRVHVENARVFGIGRGRTVLRVIIPSALPAIFAGLRVSLSMALILMVVSEMLAATNGIGFEILSGMRAFRIIDMWAGIALLSVIGAGLNLLLRGCERRSLRWRRDLEEAPA
ncbi:ABC transporter permease [Gulosibacter sp. 10]|uniref:ABC transporter permease n=1 Tax=Gulosibacter sp. 10 TaxID=1255570 RepID=UPI00097E9955|nr:ABC transporter permease [Gulosibacter sp. 10]SJM54543.1 Alkanesulfonates transport system permease protein [Gulosibacter sp. 10]